MEGSSAYSLAGHLGSVFSDRAQIGSALTRAGLGDAMADVPEGTPRTQWLSILTKLSQKQDTQTLAKLLAHAGDASSATDWTHFADLLAPQPAAAGAGQTVAAPGPTYTAFELRWHGTNEPSAGSRIADRQVMVDVIVSVQYSGQGTPARPTISAMEGRGPLRRKIPGTRIIPGPEETKTQGLATFTTYLLVSPNHLRGKRIEVAVQGAESEETRYLLSKTGAWLSLGMWLVFALFATWWLGPLLGYWWGLVTALISPVVWAYLGPAIRKQGAEVSELASLLVEPVYASIAIAVLVAVVLLVPPRVLVLLTNRTGHDLELGNGTTLAAGAKRQPEITLHPDELTVDPPYCLCGVDAECECASRVASRHGIKNLDFGCIDGDCARKKKVIGHDHNHAVVRTAKGVAVQDVEFAKGTTTERMTVGDDAVLFEQTRQDDSVFLPMPKTGDNHPQTIVFHGAGKLTCSPGETRVSPLELRKDGVESLIATDGRGTSNWAWETASRDPARICSYGANASTYTFTLALTTAGTETVICTGGPVARMSTFIVKPTPTAPVIVRSGSLVSHVTSTGLIHAATLPDQKTLGLAPIEPRQEWQLPDDLDVATIEVAGADNKPVAVACPRGGTLRGVELVGVPAKPEIKLGDTVVERLSPTVGVTCGADSTAHVDNFVCSLRDKTLKCTPRSLVTDCALRANGAVDPVTPGPTCQRITAEADKATVRSRGAGRGLDCKEVYQCAQ